MRAVVLGVNGQDGSYLAEHLIGLRWKVWGVGRQEASRFVPESPAFAYRRIDLARDPGGVRALLQEVAPRQVYHFAAVHGASGFRYEPVWGKALRVNVESVHAVLEYIREASPETSLLYASSVKVFGAENPAVVRPDLPRISSCLYSITKNTSGDLIDHYRRHHGVRTTTLYLLNHESPRRAPHFFMPRVVAALAGAMRGEKTVDRLRTLDFSCDWGSSREFMRFAHRLLDCERNQDYVMASGKTWSGRDFVAALFAAAGLDWRDHLEVEFSAPSVRHFQADTSRIGEALGEMPKEGALEVARWILAESHRLRLGERGIPA